MKKKIDEFILNLKYAMMLLFSVIAMVSGVVSAMWPKTQFNHPLLVCTVSGMLTLLLLKWI